MEEIEEEINKIQYEIEIMNNTNEEQKQDIPKTQEIKKKKGQSRERMMELHKIRSEKARLKREEKEEIKKKAEEVKKMKKEILNTEYEEAQKIKEALEAKKNSKIDIKQIQEKETKILYKTASRDILKDKYLEEAKKRVMMDLFS